ncbi:DUF3006 domain-containing protein [Bacillus sp. FJAT-44742]|uniref:DUF3006 domain-containing protein n=1 Tax=Bacillus sp. FJAT-44742 TaxID=2014005 RepID=UPI000C24C53A|nr:DUF3006 domain-containing protein [Bacillus sp. FJAT-44742]
METKGVLDRIVDDHFAVILAEEIRKEFVLRREELPQGSSPGDWFVLTIKGEKITNLSFDNVQTQKMEERIQRKVEKVREKKRGSKFKRK